MELLYEFEWGVVSEGGVIMAGPEECKGERKITKIHTEAYAPILEPVAGPMPKRCHSYTECERTKADLAKLREAVREAVGDISRISLDRIYIQSDYDMETRHMFNGVIHKLQEVVNAKKRSANTKTAVVRTNNELSPAYKKHLRTDD